ncbi:MAG: response regulator [Desulfocapsaceae bacterium]|nr:response regulator [Desulfocapsaceae bacterium]
MKEKIDAKILLVDDEEEFLNTLTQRLEVRGLKVTGATRGQQAVELIDNQSFDIILLDLAMPGMDGFETLKKIKEKDPDAEIVMLSGKGSLLSGVEAVKLGAEDFLVKPVDLNDLLKRIEEAKERRILVLQKKAKKELGDILHKKHW